MSTHTKVNEEVYAEYECSLRDCGHDTCPTLRLDICQECTREAWEDHEGGAVTWQECLENLALDEFDRPTDRENRVPVDADWDAATDEQRAQYCADVLAEIGATDREVGSRDA